MAAFPTDDQLKNIRVLLELLVVIANTAVWIGVYFEKELFSKEVQDRGWLLLVRGLAAELAFGALLFVTDTTLSDRQNRELENQKGETAKVELEAEHIKQSVQWRSIMPVQVKTMAAELEKEKGSITIAFVSGDVETEMFAIALSRAISMANGKNAAPLWKGSIEARNYPDRILFGIFVPGPENDQVKAVRAAFTAANIAFNTDDVPDPSNPVMIGEGLTFTRAPKSDALVMVGLRTPPVTSIP